MRKTRNNKIQKCECNSDKNKNLARVSSQVNSKRKDLDLELERIANNIAIIYKKKTQLNLKDYIIFKRYD